MAKGKRKCKWDWSDEGVVIERNFSFSFLSFLYRNPKQKNKKNKKKNRYNIQKIDLDLSWELK